VTRTSTPITILVADDDADDRLMIQEAFEESRIANRLDFVVDGEQLLQYLRREGEFSRLAAEPYPAWFCSISTCPGRTAARRCAT
jgi:CheY-like chemotaxis protein